MQNLKNNEDQRSSAKVYWFFNIKKSVYSDCGAYLIIEGSLINTVPYILVYKSNFLDVKMGSKNRPRLIFGRT